MAAWREIDAIRKNAAAIRSTAKRLLALPGNDLTEWEIGFLGAMTSHRGPDDLTTRQAEKLLQIRDDAEFITHYRGFSVKALIEGCYDARLDLGEDDERWIADIRKRSAASIKRKHVGRLMRCSRQLYLIDEEAA